MHIPISLLRYQRVAVSDIGTDNKRAIGNRSRINLLMDSQERADLRSGQTRPGAMRAMQRNLLLSRPMV